MAALASPGVARTLYESKALSMQSSMASGTLYESCMCSAEFTNHYFYEYMQNLYSYGHKQCPWYYHGHSLWTL